MTAVRYRKLWIKFLVVLFLTLLGGAVVWYAYQAYEARQPVPEEEVEEKIVPTEEEL